MRKRRQTKTRSANKRKGQKLRGLTPLEARTRAEKAWKTKRSRYRYGKRRRHAAMDEDNIIPGDPELGRRARHLDDPDEPGLRPRRRGDPRDMGNQPDVGDVEGMTVRSETKGDWQRRMQEEAEYYAKEGQFRDPEFLNALTGSAYVQTSSGRLPVFGERNTPELLEFRERVRKIRGFQKRQQMDRIDVERFKEKHGYEPSEYTETPRPHLGKPLTAVSTLANQDPRGTGTNVDHMKVRGMAYDKLREAFRVRDPLYPGQHLNIATRREMMELSEQIARSYTGSSPVVRANAASRARKTANRLATKADRTYERRVQTMEQIGPQAPKLKGWEAAEPMSTPYRQAPDDTTKKKRRAPGKSQLPVELEKNRHIATDLYSRRVKVKNEIRELKKDRTKWRQLEHKLAEQAKLDEEFSHVRSVLEQQELRAKVFAGRAPKTAKEQELLKQDQNTDLVRLIAARTAERKPPVRPIDDPRLQGHLTIEDTYKAWGHERERGLKGLRKHKDFMKEQARRKAYGIRSGSTALGWDENGKLIPLTSKTEKKAVVAFAPNTQYRYTLVDPNNPRSTIIRRVDSYDRETEFKRGRRDKFGHLLPGERDEVIRVHKEPRKYEKHNVEFGERTVKNEQRLPEGVDRRQYVGIRGAAGQTRTVEDPSGEKKLVYEIQSGGRWYPVNKGEYEQTVQDYRRARPIPKKVQYVYVDPDALQLKPKEKDTLNILIPGVTGRVPRDVLKQKVAKRHLGIGYDFPEKQLLGERVLKVQLGENTFIDKTIGGPVRARQTRRFEERALRARQFELDRARQEAMWEKMGLDPGQLEGMRQSVAQRHGYKDERELKTLSMAALAAGYYTGQRQVKKGYLPNAFNKGIGHLRQRNDRLGRWAKEFSVPEVVFDVDEGIVRPAVEKAANVPFMVQHPMQSPSGRVMGFDVGRWRYREHWIRPSKREARKLERERNMAARVVRSRSFVERHRERRGPGGIFTRWRSEALTRPNDYKHFDNGAQSMVGQSVRRARDIRQSAQNLTPQMIREELKMKGELTPENFRQALAQNRLHRTPHSRIGTFLSKDAKGLEENVIVTPELSRHTESFFVGTQGKRGFKGINQLRQENRQLVTTAEKRTSRIKAFAEREARAFEESIIKEARERGVRPQRVRAERHLMKPVVKVEQSSYLKPVLITGAVIGTAAGAHYLYHRHQEKKKDEADRIAYYNKILPPTFTGPPTPRVRTLESQRISTNALTKDMKIAGKKVPTKLGVRLERRRIALRPSERGGEFGPYPANLPIGKPRLRKQKGVPKGSLKESLVFDAGKPVRRAYARGTHEVYVGGIKVPGQTTVGRPSETKLTGTNPKRLTQTQRENIVWAHAGTPLERDVKNFYSTGKTDRIVDMFEDPEEVTQIRKRKSQKAQKAFLTAAGRRATTLQTSTRAR